MRLYAAYEQFAVDLVASWLAGLPTLFPLYASLPDVIRRNHCSGTAHILPKAGQGRYDHLSVTTVIGSLNNGLAGVVPYSFCVETFLIQDQNLRSNTLDQLFAKVGVEHCWGWISSHPKMERFVTDEVGGTETAESLLKSLVDYRNEAAHGEVANVLDVGPLTQLCNFVQILCESLAERVEREYINAELNIGTAVEAGVAIGSYQNNAIVVRTNEPTFYCGQKLAVMGERYCFNVTIEEIQLDRFVVDNVMAAQNAEIGLRCDSPIPKNAKLLIRRASEE